MNWHLVSTPFKVQSLANERASRMAGFGYFMEMGLGKTAVALNEFVELYKEGKVDRMFVLCPNTVKTAWKLEIWVQGLHVIQTIIWDDLPDEVDDTAIFVMNYEALLTERGQRAIEEFYKGRRVYFCADESHRIKNWKAKTTKLAITVAKESEYRRILTGSPMTQDVMDYYSQLRVIGQLSGMNPIAFRAMFAKMGGYMGKKVIGINNQEALEQILLKCSFRATKKDWLDIPDKTFTTRDIALTSKAMRLYNEMKQDFLTVVNGEEVTASMVISQMMKLQQISSGFLMSETGVAIPIVDHGENAKVREVLDTLEQIQGPMIVFAHYRYSIDILTEALAEFKPAHIVGGQKDVEEQKRRFNAGETRVIICQMQTGSLGHTLLGPKDNQCTTTFFYENSYVLGDRMQAEDRNHRIGQKNAVTYVDCVSSPIERRVILALQHKLNLVNEIVKAVKESPDARATVRR